MPRRWSAQATRNAGRTAPPGRSAHPAALERLVAEFAARRPIRCTSLIVTLFGDVVSQHGGTLWLGSLVEALGLLGIDERLVRTSTFRLVQEGWLEASRAGRRSFYRFTDHGNHEYERAARRIYLREQPRWDGSWTLLLPSAVPEAQREAFRQSAAWAGFGTLAPNLYAHPGADSSAIDEALAELGIADRVVVMRAGTDAVQSQRLLREVLWKNWQLEELAAAYARFVQGFAPARSALARLRTLGAETAFVTRVLLIHEYRRALLHDTDLPAELLPRDWPGHAARELAAGLYGLVAAGSAAYIRRYLHGERGAPGPQASTFALRFTR